MVADGPLIRLLPQVNEDNRFFWTSGADGKLRFQRCPACRSYIHPPAPRCPYCWAAEPVPEAVSGRATVASFTVNHQQWIPGSEPYVIAWVTIAEAEDVRLTTNLTGIEPEQVTIGMPVEVHFEQCEDVYLPLFRPAGPRPDGGGA